MGYIQITKENIEKEHICCAMSNSQSNGKKEWLKERFEEGLVFYRSELRGKCFIEYIPSENAWLPLDAPNYLVINCLWIAGSLKGKGYANDLLNKCIMDAKASHKDGICILTSTKRKKEFLADPKFLSYKGFQIADEAIADICLMYLPLKAEAMAPKFKACAKKGKIEETGFVVYYSDQCPFTYYWVARVKEVADEKGIEMKLVHITTKEMARNMPCLVTTYALFKDGKFLTQSILSDKKFLKLIEK